MTDKIQELTQLINEANVTYRTGNAIMSDKDYDLLIENLRVLDPENELLDKVGIEVIDETRKTKLPIEMRSMNKLKTFEEVLQWLRLKGININSEFVMTPKLDGLSLCVDEAENSALTRGDGTYGQRSDEHYKLIQNHLYEDIFGPNKPGGDPFAPLTYSHTYGEVIMPKQVFADKYASEFANPRNLVAGLLNSKDATEPLKDTVYIKYGAILPNRTVRDFTFTKKSDILQYLNDNQRIKIDYHVCNGSELSEELLVKLFNDWSADYEIDGIIIEVNDLDLQDALGRETSSGNPCYARAFKHESFEQKAEATVIGLSWNISKHGLLKPIIHITPVKLDGVTVSNVTGNNAKFIKEMGIGIGAKVVVKRSGMVIPLIVEVLETVDFVEPTVAGTEIAWNENGIELYTLSETSDQKIKQIIAFFEILEADNISEGVVNQLWQAGYESIDSILALTTKELENIDRFGKRKAEIVYKSIKKCTNDVSLSKLQHATGIFKGLGSLRLVKLEHFKTKPSVEDVMMIDGFAESSAKSYVDSYDEFFDFIKGLPITIIEKAEAVKVSNDLEGMSFIFTGVRRPDLVKIIESRGGKECSSVSKNTTHLVCVDKSSSSSKMKKAIDLGIQILDVKDLENLLSL